MGLKFANTQETKRFEDGDDYLVLRTELTKHESDQLVDLQSGYRIDPAALTSDPQANRQVELIQRTADANRQLFAVLAVEWSMGDDKPTAADYDRLDQASGKWVDDCITEILLERQRRAEGKRSGSRRRGASRSSPRKAGASG